jgi:tetratricopeptide (TPR) repeat protein
MAEAAAAFRQVMRIMPGHASVYLNCGSGLFDAGNWLGAEVVLRIALALRPDYAYALFQMGRVHRRLDRRDPARLLLAAARRMEAPRADFELEAAMLAVERGDIDGAMDHGRRTLVLDPADYHGQLALGIGWEGHGQGDDALIAYSRAIRCNPGFGEAFSRHAMLLLDSRWGPPPVPRPAPGRPGRRLASTRLGIAGRFGNQILQYGFLRIYAAEHDLDLEVPDWVGRRLFDLDDPLPGPPLPRRSETAHDFAASLNREIADVCAGSDLEGFFCYHTGRLARFREQYRQAFHPGRHVRPLAAEVEARLRQRGRTVVALHLRRGDFGWGPFWIAPVEWYRRWLSEAWSGFDGPVLYVATDAPELVQELAEFAPMTAADLPAPPPGADFLTDFLVLAGADAVAISNSTFSFAATMLNRRGRLFLRPDRRPAALVPYDPWSAEVLL